MIRALLLIFEPVEAWERVVRAQRSVVQILTLYLVPMLLLAAAAEGCGLTLWGKMQTGVMRQKIFSPGEVVLYELAQILLTLAVVFSGAKFVKSLGDTFHGRNNFAQAFTVVAYGLSPIYVLRLLDAFPSVNPWVTWLIGIVLSVPVLYRGVPLVMQPDPAHAFGLYVMSTLLLTIMTGLARLVTAWYLTGHFTTVESVIQSIGARLPF